MMVIGERQCILAPLKTTHHSQIIFGLKIQQLKNANIEKKLQMIPVV
jgi:hypothetical protein